MHEAKINNTVIHYPSEWDELARVHLGAIAGLSLMNLQEMQFKTHLLFHLANIQVDKTDSARNPENYSEMLFKVSIKNGHPAYMSALQMYDLLNGFDFLFKKIESKEGISLVLDSHLTKNLIPAFKVGGTTYYGPSDKLFNVSFSEFIHTETNLSRFVRSKEVVHLNKLIAILYRPEDPTSNPGSPDYKGDRRLPFNDHHINDLAEQISKLNHTVKMCIYLFYSGCQWWIQNQFPHVFRQKSKGKDDGLGFLGLVDALTGGDVTKTEDVRKSYLMDVMIHLEQSAIEYEKVKDDLKKR